ncbi:FeoA family protein [Alkalidesulfovibrio alkalitolerans DSM 16529]|jgi:Fe2+ transport system protein FeoA|uniref:FeoA family protein n=1 Tax=Alkalidesulfovibrio alkalitolerans DSM 16529 TaxID=1121439 RepID=S7UKF0_9BACT|nr:FeoA family protein [Alkalidesulfovibrio alkalitolerans]EPR32763.1 FeoA family protein [Alkalidesulfovibrio alkalitolerans DSM 16529]
MSREPVQQKRHPGTSLGSEQCATPRLPKTGTLAAMAEGDSALILGFSGERDIRTRIESMGLVPGVEVHVVSNCGGGPLLVSLDGSRLTLGRNVADGILVA